MATAAPPPVPADFVEYATRRLPPLAHAARQLHGDDASAEALARELLVLVALRWTRLRAADEEYHAEPGAAADRYLHRLFEREVRDAAPRHRVRLDLDRAPAERWDDLAADPADEAAALWTRGRALVRRRLLLAGGIAGAALVATGIREWSRRGEQGELSVRPFPSPRSASPSFVIDLPGVERLPDAGEQARAPRALVDRLPRELVPPVAPESLPALSERPVGQALALLVPDRSAYVLALGRDGSWCRVDSVEERVGARLEEGSLSPDGSYAAFTETAGVRVVDLATGRARSYPRGPLAMSWVAPGLLLLGVDALMDVATGRLLPVPLDARDVAAVRRAPGPERPESLFEVLSGDASGGPAVLRRTDLATRRRRSFVIAGDGAPYLGPFLGTGFTVAGAGGLVARRCIPHGLMAGAAVAVLEPATGALRRVLAVDEAAAGEVRLLGWLDRRRLLLSCTGGQGVPPGLRRRVLAWDLRDGRLGLVATAPGTGALSLADLAGAV
ncbi:hypothetical protein CS0771_09210 [Catellatospora sp. IY07-71]|uniref:hypothetical protein n=1 Tax=Catellatospora sp. IY07-71 TaxID=2728827 RepID=UPI001BB42635|nr:hypothetical protein [Catellatospora sp. IY07-71]BCJ71377.1 hypothetical protein CS0771_09210 [Catellatospora sp. IY07-71]